jgi:hypothetical protein
MMHGHGKSDSSIIPGRPTKEAGPGAKESVEGRGLAKGKTPERNMPRTQSRSSMPSALERIRDARIKDESELYHSYSLLSVSVITQGKSRMR